MNEEEKKSIIKTIIILSAILIVLPIGVGLILSFSLKNFLYLELSCAIVGILALLAVMIRIYARDGHNYKKTKTVHEDKDTSSYQKWISIQFALVILGIILIALSVIFFYAFQNFYK